MTQRSARPPAGPIADRRRPLLWSLLAGAALLAALIGGYVAGGRRGPDARVKEIFPATVVKVSSSGRSTCVKQDETGVQRCGSSYEWGGIPRAKPGDRVTVHVVELHPGPSEIELFLITRGPLSSFQPLP